MRKCWVIPKKRSGEFVSAMEDVLEVYARPFNPDIPVVCMDEQPIQLIRETRTPLLIEPGRPLRYDYEYERNGTANHFLFTQPLANWRKVNIKETKTKQDWAKEIGNLPLKMPG